MSLAQILSECGFCFEKRFGQNFLTDVNLLDAEADADADGDSGADSEDAGDEE